MGSLAKKAYSGFALNINDPELLNKATILLNNMLIGKLNNTGTAKLTKDATTTTVSDVRCGPGTVVQLMPTSSDGAIALDQWYIAQITNGYFTITHGSTSTSNATAAYAILG